MSLQLFDNKYPFLNQLGYSLSLFIIYNWLYCLSLQPILTKKAENNFI